jgi:hypothetical protein
VTQKEAETVGFAGLVALALAVAIMSAGTPRAPDTVRAADMAAEATDAPPALEPTAPSLWGFP